VATSQLTIEAPAETASLPYSVAGALIAFGLTGEVLVAVGHKDYPDLHIILDTSMSLLSGRLALLLWDMGTRIGHPFPRSIAIGFAATAVLEFLHLGKSIGYFVLPLSLMKITSSDMIERNRVETKLTRLNEDLEQRVLERTEELHWAYWSTAGGSR